MKIYIENRPFGLQPTFWHKLKSRNLLEKFGYPIKKFKDGYLVWDWDWANKNLCFENVGKDFWENSQFIRLNKKELQR